MKKKISKFGWLDFVLGIALIVLGVYTLFNPQSALSGIVLVYSLMAVVTGICDIVFYFRLKSDAGAGPTVSLVTGIIGILAGLMLLLNPALGWWIVSVFFAVWFIAHSISRLANYRAIRLAAGRAIAITSVVLNSIGVLLGVVMFISPAVSALSLGYLVAVALALHGAGSLMESFSGLGEAGAPEITREEEWGRQR